MGVFEAILERLDKMEQVLQNLKKPEISSEREECLITVGQASRILGCSGEYIRQKQNDGVLSLCFLPGSTHRRVLKSEVLALLNKSVVLKAKK